MNKGFYPCGSFTTMRGTLNELYILHHLFIVQEEDYLTNMSSTYGIPNGTLLPLLSRLEEEGYLSSFEEAVTDDNERRPRRLYYRINEDKQGV